MAKYARGAGGLQVVREQLHLAFGAWDPCANKLGERIESPLAMRTNTVLLSMQQCHATVIGPFLMMLENRNQ